MTSLSLRTLTASVGVLALSTAFAAAAPAVVQGDLNLRSGPGTDYEVVAAMPAGATVNVMGCQGGWCRVAFGGTAGFASRSYLGMGGVAVRGPVYGASVYGPDASYDEGFAVGYEPGYDEGYVSGGYRRGYAYRDNGFEGDRSYGSVGETRVDARVGIERNGEFRHERNGEFRREGEFQRGREARGERTGERTATREEQGTRQIPATKGNNPMKDYKSSVNSNLSRPQGQAAEIKGNNPMKDYKNAANSNRQPTRQQAGEIKGNNPMKDYKSSTTGAGPR